MKTTINYQEISSLALNGYNKDVEISKISEKTIKICYNPGVIAPNIIVNVSITNLCNNIIDLKYECSAEYSRLGSIGLSSILDFVDKWILSIKKYIPEGIEVYTDERIVKVDLNKFEKLEKALQYLSLSDIIFNEDDLSVMLSIAQQISA